MPRCCESFCTSLATESSGTSASAPPCTIRPEDGQGARKLKSYMLAGSAMLMKPWISGRRISSCMPIQAPNEKPGDPAAAAVGVVLLHPVERGRGIAQLALAVVEALLRAADAAEVEAQHREAAADEHVEQVVDDLVVHRAAMQRMRVQDQRQRRVGPRAVMVAPLQAAIGPVEDHFRHVSLPTAAVGCRAQPDPGPSCRRADADRHLRQVVDPNPQPLIFGLRM